MTSAEYIFTVAKGPVKPPHDHGAVAVIDGQTAKITPFRTANMPPPMSMFDLETSLSIVDIVFDQLHSLVAILHRGGLDIYQWHTKGDRSIRPKLMSKVAFDIPTIGSDSLRVPVQVCFSSSEEICVLVRDLDELKIEAYSLTSESIQLHDVVDLRGTDISLIASNPGLLDDIEAYAQDRAGKLYSLSRSGGLTPVALRIPAQLPWFELISIDDRTVAVGMGRNGRLYADDKLVAKNCTSFIITDAHLIFTTNNHFVKFVHLLDPQGNTSIHA